MLTVAPRLIEKRARRLVRRIKKKLINSCTITIKETEARVGGGALPEEPLTSWSVVIKPYTISVNHLEEKLRAVPVPVIGRIEEGLYLLDMRTVADDEIMGLSRMLLQVFGLEEK